LSAFSGKAACRAKVPNLKSAFSGAAWHCLFDGLVLEGYKAVQKSGRGTSPDALPHHHHIFLQPIAHTIIYAELQPCL